MTRGEFYLGRFKDAVESFSPALAAAKVLRATQRDPNWPPQIKEAREALVWGAFTALRVASYDLVWC